jgi:pimeloyl-ACP methyl ester carboxylesterase
MIERFVVQAADGRRVDALTAGPADGRPFVFHPGTPGGLVPPPSMVAAAGAAGLRYIQYARPGYEHSEPQRGRVVGDAASDAVAVLEHLGAGSFVTAGWSGGGPHALACAALAPGCLGAASIAGVAPRDASGLDWLAGMAQENHAEFAAAEAGEDQISAFLSAAAEVLAQVTGEQVAGELGDLVTGADLAVLTGDFAEYLAGSFRGALTTGIAGWRDDDLAFTRDWGFEPAKISVPVSVWQGDQDAMVPFAHGQWLASRVPGARAHLLPGEGHLSLVAARAQDIVAELIALSPPTSEN